MTFSWLKWRRALSLAIYVCIDNILKSSRNFLYGNLIVLSVSEVEHDAICIKTDGLNRLVTFVQLESCTVYDKLVRVALAGHIKNIPRNTANVIKTRMLFLKLV